LGVGHSEHTPVETATAVDTTSVSASHVVESGSPVLQESPKATGRAG
ncbi:MAG: putative transposase, partial [Halobacteriales archaeon]